MDDLEPALARLEQIVQRRPADREIRLEEAKGAVNALIHYGRAGRFDDLERWGGRLIGLAEAPAFAADREIRLEEARGAYNALIHYGQLGAAGSGARTGWRKRLAAVARTFPGALDIQKFAKAWDVSYADQMVAFGLHGTQASGG